MNVVHLDIVINIAYGKFSMKIYDIIVQEGIGTKILGAGEKQAVRRFATKTEELAFQTAVEKLSNEMVRQMRRGEITDAIRIDKPWQYISSDLSGTKWASDKSWMNDMFSAAIKDANERMERLTANTGTTGGSPAIPSSSSSTANATAKSGIIASLGTWLNRVLNALLGYALFINVKDVMTNPTDGYFTTMQYAVDKLKQGKITPAAFEEWHEKQLKLIASRLVWIAAPTLGITTVWAAFRLLNLSTLWLLSSQLAKIESAVAGGEKLLYGAYLYYLNSDAKIPGTDMTPKEGITFLVVLNAIKLPWGLGELDVPSPISGSLALVANSVEKGLVLAYESLAEKYGVSVNDTIKKVGINKKIPTTVPWSEKGIKSPTDNEVPATNKPAPVSKLNPETSDSTGKFNPADWKKLPTGFYQSKRTGDFMSPQDFEKKSQSQ
jgi:hypothetical protein